MKIKFLNLTSILALLIIAFSCLEVNDPVSTRTEQEELNQINAYIKNLIQIGYDIDTTDLGVYYITIEEGEGAFPKTGDTITIGYAGYYLNDALFYSTSILDPDGQTDVVIGTPPTIQGWVDGLKHVREGGKIEFIVPSSLAYGSVGEGKIGPYQTLVFVVKLYAIKPGEEQ